MDRKTPGDSRELVRLFSERDKLSAQLSDIDRQIRIAVGLVDSGRFKPSRKTLSNDQFKAACGVM